MQLRVDEDNGIVVIGDYVLRRVALQSLSIGGQLIIDSSNDDSTGISKKVVSGYDDKTVSISLTVIPEDDGGRNYESVQMIEEIFSDTESGKPKIYELVHDHIKARGIKKLLFSSFSSSESNSNTAISVSLEFVEFIPARWASEKKNMGASGIDGTDPEAEKKKEEDKFSNGIIDGNNSAKNMVSGVWK